MQLCRSLRWNNLLAPIGARVPTGPLLAISAVGVALTTTAPSPKPRAAARPVPAR